MSYKTTRTALRIDASVPFYEDQLGVHEAVDYIQTTYKDTGKFLSKTVTVSDNDKLSTTEVVWDSVNSWMEFISDTYLIENFFTPLRAYEVVNNIISTYTTE